MRPVQVNSLLRPQDHPMTWQRHITKRRLLILLVLLAAASLYSGAWYLTHLYGVPQVRSAVAKTMRFSPEYTKLPKRPPAFTGPCYYCSSEFYAPFLVQVDYGWHGGPLYGGGGTALYLWFFGHTYRMQELGQWAE